MISDITFYLLEKGAHIEPKRITTGEVAKQIGVSQQTASRKLLELENQGDIEKVSGKLILTEKAISKVRACVAMALDALEGSGMSFTGTLVQGLGEGAYYLSQGQYTREFKKKLGFKPFAGTLNVSIVPEDIEKRITLRQQKPIAIKGFKKGKRTFGSISAYKCAISGVPCAIVFPERSSHGLHMLEIISKFNLRKKLSLSDGKKVLVEVVNTSGP